MKGYGPSGHASRLRVPRSGVESSPPAGMHRRRTNALRQSLILPLAAFNREVPPAARVTPRRLPNLTRGPDACIVASRTSPSDHSTGSAPRRSIDDPMINPSATPRLGVMNTDAHAGSIEITCTPDLREFPITTVPAMPLIQVQARVLGTTPTVSAITMYEWTATLDFSPAECTNGVGPPFPRQVLNGISRGGAFDVRFTEIQGGGVTIRVKARVAGGEVVGERNGLRIVGTNPQYPQLTQALASRTFRALVWHESRGRQFLGTANGGTSRCPLFSADRLGGVGLMQLTRPAPTREQVWNWRANVAAGLALFQVKMQAARAFPAQYRASAAFQSLVTAYNAERVRNGLLAIPIGIADFTADQVELDALRGYNGWSGGIHEFRAACDAAGKLIVDLAADGKSGTARWEQVSAADRRTAALAAGVPEARLGDTDYVRHVTGANVPY
jgi:hypothetical protein